MKIYVGVCEMQRRLRKKTSHKKKVAPTYYSRFRGVARGVGTVARLARDVQFLRNVVNVEKKYVDTTASSTVSSTATLTLLNGMQLGTTSTTRLGQSVKFVSYVLNVWMSISASASVTAVRIMIVVDSQANEAAPISTQILTAVTIQSPLNIANGKRFTVLFDKVSLLNSAGPQGVQYRKFRKIDFHTRFNTANAGTIADIETNSVYILLLSNEATNTPTVSYYCRMRFIDN